MALGVVQGFPEPSRLPLTFAVPPMPPHAHAEKPIHPCRRGVDAECCGEAIAPHRRAGRALAMTRAGALFVGTSGWEYDDWKGRVYPGELPRRRWLEHYATLFDTVELNSTFYQLPRTQESVARWHDAVPGGFAFAAKMSRYLTHVRRLSESAEPVQRFTTALQPLRDRLAVTLIQLPPTLEFAPERLDETLRHMPRGWRVAVEPRHASWWRAELRDLLERHHAALVWADRHSSLQNPDWRTADWVYLRFHGDATPEGGYRRATLERYASTLSGCEGYVYFNNDHLGHAVADALALRALIEGPAQSRG
jgi:uncharacterized protein YecE (DUF72 family)